MAAWPAVKFSEGTGVGALSRNGDGSSGGLTFTGDFLLLTD